MQNKAEQQGLDWGEIMEKAEVLKNQDPSVTIPKVEVVAEPAGKLHM
jgi:hypothetical protein